MKLFVSFLITLAVAALVAGFCFVMHLITEGAKTMGIDLYVTIAIVACYFVYVWRQNFKRLTVKE